MISANGGLPAHRYTAQVTPRWPPGSEPASLATIRRLATRNIWASNDDIGGGDSPDVQWLGTLEVPTPPPARPPFRPARWQVPAGENPTNYVQNHEPYDRVLPGSLPLPGEVPSTCDLTTMNVENYRAVTVALSIRLPLAFRWLVGDAESAMGLAQSARGHEWGELSFCSGRLRPGDNIYRVMAAWLTSDKTLSPTGYDLLSNGPISQPSRHHKRAPMEMRPWPGRPKVSRPRHTTGPAQVTRSRWRAWPRDAAVDTHKQAGRQSTALTWASSCSCHVTKRFRILADLKQGNKGMYSNTSGYVHMGLRLDWGKGITGQ